MIKIEQVSIYGFEEAIRGMRNPHNSWDKSDSAYVYDAALWADDIFTNTFFVGPNDMELMQRLFKAGTDHRKFMRMIVCYADITAPLYWWKEFDTYRAGVIGDPEKNSCSTMHSIAEKEFTMDDFSHDKLIISSVPYLKDIIHKLNRLRLSYLEIKDAEVINSKITEKDYWWQIIQLLPSSYMQKRTVMMSYEALANMRKSRKGHKLDEWSVGFMDFIDNLPYFNDICGDR